MPRRRRFSFAFTEHRPHRMMMSSSKPSRFKASEASRELRTDDLCSPRELAQIAYDVGVQLGAGSLRSRPDHGAYPRSSAN